MIEIEALVADPWPVAVERMGIVDDLPRPFRALVNEYGFEIVAAMIDEGAHDARNLERDLRTWRKRRQATWLATDIRLRG